MYYGNILYYDIANGPGIRTALFVSGCRNHCPGCFNEVTWDFHYGKPYTDQTEAEIIDSLKLPVCDGLTILGGEPFEPENQPTVLHLIQEARSAVPEKSIWMYSGYTWEKLTGQIPSHAYLKDITPEILKNIDTLVDGKFMLEKRDLMLNYRGSSNQRIIEVQPSLKHPENPPILSHYMTDPPVISL